DLLKMLHWAKPPKATAQTNKAHRTKFKRLGEAEMIDEVFQNAGHGAIVFRTDHNQTITFFDLIQISLDPFGFIVFAIVRTAEKLFFDVTEINDSDIFSNFLIETL